ncbi:hypothetical protein EJP82_18275 [Paenibacillus anaericanus]|uniref:Uncharacterized protein n=1 Tax=Paenibacillus anaericanus TaxID=170367 RepID=A0A433Y5F5_9BACL|nr:hypothetical protein [Paenibacillus anaericanus]RUT43892.1 hypothetical protein EJP82_18275 [Paenibacillus anaericanus]
MKSEISYVTDAGHELLHRESNQYIQKVSDSRIPNQGISKQGTSKQRLIEERKILWRHLMMDSGDIRQPWYDKLLRFREHT